MNVTNEKKGINAMKNSAIHRYCLKLLKTHECPRDTYKGADRDEVISSLKEFVNESATEEEKKSFERFGVASIADELISIGNSVENKKSRYLVVWDTDSETCGIEAGNNFEVAKSRAMEILIEWQCQFGGDGQNSRDDWDYMIYNCGVKVYKLNPDTNEHEEFWYPSSEDCKKIGWELSEDMSDNVYDSYSSAFGWQKRM